MHNRTLILGLAAVIAIAVGAALSFFELTALGVIAAIVAIALAVGGRLTRQAPGR
jgi:membrane protein implicated in regulation of membrane protease activity